MTGQLIIDEFTHLPLSASAKCQRRKRLRGECRWCKQPALPGIGFCAVHKLEHKIKRRLTIDQVKWTPGSIGKKPYCLREQKQDHAA